MFVPLIALVATQQLFNSKDIKRHNEAAQKHCKSLTKSLKLSSPEYVGVDGDGDGMQCFEAWRAAPYSNKGVEITFYEFYYIHWAWRRRVEGKPIGENDTLESHLYKPAGRRIRNMTVMSDAQNLTLNVLRNDIRESTPEAKFAGNMSYGDLSTLMVPLDNNQFASISLNTIYEFLGVVCRQGPGMWIIDHRLWVNQTELNLEAIEDQVGILCEDLLKARIILCPYIEPDRRYLVVVLPGTQELKCFDSAVLGNELEEIGQKVTQMVRSKLCS